MPDGLDQHLISILPPPYHNVIIVMLSLILLLTPQHVIRLILLLSRPSTHGPLLSFSRAPRQASAAFGQSIKINQSGNQSIIPRPLRIIIIIMYVDSSVQWAISRVHKPKSGLCTLGHYQETTYQYQVGYPVKRPKACGTALFKI